MSDYASRATLADDPEFRRAVQTGLTVYAFAVRQEAAPAAERLALADAILAGVERYDERFARVISATAVNAAVWLQISNRHEGRIDTAIDAAFDLLAGVP